MSADPVPSSEPRAADALALLEDIQNTLLEPAPLRVVISGPLRRLVAHFGAQRAALTLMNPDSGVVQTESAWGPGRRPLDVTRVDVAERAAAEVMQTGQTHVLCPDAGRLGDGRRRPRNHGTACVSVPVRCGLDLIGALGIELMPTDESTLHAHAKTLALVATLMGARAGSVGREIERPAPRSSIPPAPRTRFRPRGMLGSSRAIQQVYDLVGQVADTPTTVLLRGESGTGKELVAQALHDHSARASRPFIRVNCAALPESVIESELFGHEKGAFTGAVAQRKGRFELADGGTIFLDEIGDLSAPMQVKLLRVLQEREFERVGGDRTIRVDVRVIAATNRDLEAFIGTERFRQDLYYRLNVFPIHLPPLRERKTDITLLTDHFVERFNDVHGRQVRRVSTPALDMLVAYHWPGNVRELENTIERAVLLSSDGVIHGRHLPPSLQTPEATGTIPSGTLRASLDAIEREILVDALKATRGNMTQAARQLGITERIMGLRVKKYRLDPRTFHGKAGTAA